MLLHIASAGATSAADVAYNYCCYFKILPATAYCCSADVAVAVAADDAVA
jgi:hypothetical protein